MTQRNEPDGVALAEPEFLCSYGEKLGERGHRFELWRPVEGIGAAAGLEFTAGVTAVAEPVRRGGGCAAVWEV